MNGSKVEVIFGHDCNVSTAYTTHADYRALEERLAESSARENFLADEVIHMAEELASIKARARELFEADKEYDDMMLSTQAEYSQQDCRATEARRRKAMEAFK